MKQKLLLVFFIFACTILQIGTFAQSIGIGTSTPDPSAVLDVSGTKGFLMPRMTTAQRNAIVLPATGLMLINLDDNCMDVWNGTAWIKNCGVNIETDTVTSYWFQKTNFAGTARFSAVGFSIGSKGYIGTGSDGSFRKDLWEYDPAANSWAQKADFGGTGRIGAVGFSVGSKGYIGTGFDVSYRKDFWEYDPAANTWVQKTDFGGTARYYAAGFSIGSKGYIGTGLNGFALNDFWEYNPVTDTWTTKAVFGGTARYSAVGFSIGSKGYIGTGLNLSLRKDFWEYDPAANSWMQRTDFAGTARFSGVGFSIGSKGYIGTGQDDVSNRKDFWEYDPVANNWAQKADFGGTARYFAVGFNIGSKGYIGTGYDGSFVGLKDFWEYSTSASIVNNSGGHNIYQYTDALWSKKGDSVFNTGLNTRLGIGTNTPTVKLDVSGTGGLRVKSTNPGNGSADWIAGNFGGASNDRVVIGNINATATIGAHNNDLSAWNTLAINPYGGNVGIGTITPVNKLSVSGNMNVTGNMGIGTGTPAAKLDVVGTTRTTNFQMTIGAAANRILQSDASGNAGWVDAGTLTITETDPKVGTLSSNKIPKWNGTSLADGLITDNGTNVGIGTGTPAAKLDVVGTTRTTNFQMTIGAAANRVLQSDASGNAGWVDAGTLTITETDPQVGVNIANYLSKWNGTALVTSGIFENNGNMGIGNSNPQQKLSVGDVATDNQVLLIRGYSNAPVFWKGGAAFGYDQASVIMGQVNSIATIGGHNGNLSAWANLAINPDGGNVGIGSTTPSNKLSVSGNMDVTGNMGIGIAAPSKKLDVSGTGGIRVSSTYSGTGPNTDWIAGNFGGSGVGAFGDRVVMGILNGTATIGAHTNDLTAWETLAINPGGGKVGIGTNIPSQTLDVNGSFGNAIISTTSSLTLDATHHTVIIQPTNSAVTITLSPPNISPRRVYIIVNRDNNDHTISNYFPIVPIPGNIPSTIIPAGTSITVQSDDIFWYQIR